MITNPQRRVALISQPMVNNAPNSTQQRERCLEDRLHAFSLPACVPLENINFLQKIVAAMLCPSHAFATVNKIPSTEFELRLDVKPDEEKELPNRCDDEQYKENWQSVFEKISALNFLLLLLCISA